jgi:hypothetical protein
VSFCGSAAVHWRSLLFLELAPSHWAFGFETTSGWNLQGCNGQKSSLDILIYIKVKPLCTAGSSHPVTRG